MEIVNEHVKMLSKKIICSRDLTAEFKELFKSPEAKVKSVVYFILSDKPIPRVKGESRILYIGQTVQSINKRYYRYSEHLASNSTGEFYEYIIKNFGGITMGYINSDNPRKTEKEYFKKYFKTYLDYPPKSKVG